MKTEKEAMLMLAKPPPKNVKEGERKDILAQNMQKYSDSLSTPKWKVVQ